MIALLLVSSSVQQVLQVTLVGHLDLDNPTSLVGVAVDLHIKIGKDMLTTCRTMEDTAPESRNASGLCSSYARWDEPEELLQFCID